MKLNASSSPWQPRSQGELCSIGAVPGTGDEPCSMSKPASWETDPHPTSSQIGSWEYDLYIFRPAAVLRQGSVGNQQGHYLLCHIMSDLTSLYRGLLPDHLKTDARKPAKDRRSNTTQQISPTQHSPSGKTQVLSGDYPGRLRL